MDFITLDTELPNNFNEIVNHLKGNLVPALTVNYESFQAKKVKPETLQLARRKEATAAQKKVQLENGKKYGLYEKWAPNFQGPWDVRMRDELVAHPSRGGYLPGERG